MRRKKVKRVRSTTKAVHGCCTNIRDNTSLRCHRVMIYTHKNVARVPPTMWQLGNVSAWKMVSGRGTRVSYLSWIMSADQMQINALRRRRRISIVSFSYIFFFYHGSENEVHRIWLELLGAADSVYRPILLLFIINLSLCYCHLTHFVRKL